MDFSSFDLLTDISAYSIWLPLIVGLLSWSRHGWAQRWLFWLVVVSACAEMSVVGLRYFVRQVNNLPLLHLFTLLQTLLILTIYRRQFARGWSNRRFGLLLGAVVAIAAVNAIWIDGILHYNTTFRAFQGILLVGVIFHYFYRLLVELRVSRLEREPLFYISAVLTLYFSGNFLVFLTSESLSDKADLFWTFYSIHALLNTLVNIFYAIALWVKPDK